MELLDAVVRGLNERDIPTAVSMLDVMNRWAVCVCLVCACVGRGEGGSLLHWHGDARPARVGEAARARVGTKRGLCQSFLLSPSITVPPAHMFRPRADRYRELLDKAINLYVHHLEQQALPLDADDLTSGAADAERAALKVFNDGLMGRYVGLAPMLALPPSLPENAMAWPGDCRRDAEALEARLRSKLAKALADRRTANLAGGNARVPMPACPVLNRLTA